MYIHFDFADQKQTLNLYKRVIIYDTGTVLQYMTQTTKVRLNKSPLYNLSNTENSNESYKNLKTKVKF